jgi:hypothetical protein
VPFVIPPGQASLSGAGDPTPSDPQAPAKDVESELVLRGALHPQQVFRSQATREIDVGAGYRLDIGRGPSIHGPYAEIGYYPWQTKLDDRLTRIGMKNITEVLYKPGSSERGWGSTLAVAVELDGFVSDAGGAGGNDGFVVGAVHGELGVGMFAGVTHRELGDDRSTLLTAGISGRLPATAGVICCLR